MVKVYISSIQYGDTETFFPLGTYFALWVILWSKGTETFLDKSCLIFWSKCLNQFTITLCIKTWYSSKSDSKCFNTSRGKMFQYPHIANYWHTFLQVFNKHWIYLLLIFFHLLTCTNSTIYWDSTLQALILPLRHF